MRVRFFLKTIVSFSLILSSNDILEAGVSEEKIKRHIEVLAVDLGERNYMQYQNLERAADYIKEEFRSYGYETEEQVYSLENRPYRNIIATKFAKPYLGAQGRGKDKKDKRIIVCSHYDSAWGSPGADDNASGVAGLLELARILYKHNLNKSIRFIAFTNEEPPFFMSNDMGSFRYAQEARKKDEDIEAVLCLESLGFYSDNTKSQSYPLGLNLFYPDKGNFIGIASNLASSRLLKRIVKEFKQASNFPLQYLIAPQFFAPAISFSDNWSFWRFGYKAVMITDTAFYRNPYYHTQSDTPDKLNYEKLSSLIEVLYNVLLKLSKEEF